MSNQFRAHISAKHCLFITIDSLQFGQHHILVWNKERQPRPTSKNSLWSWSKVTSSYVSLSKTKRSFLVWFLRSAIRWSQCLLVHALGARRRLRALQNTAGLLKRPEQMISGDLRQLCSSLWVTKENVAPVSHAKHCFSFRGPHHFGRLSTSTTKNALLSDLADSIQTLTNWFAILLGERGTFRDEIYVWGPDGRQGQFTTHKAACALADILLVAVQSYSTTAVRSPFQWFVFSSWKRFCIILAIFGFALSCN